jgi:hypothetical protein
MPFWPKKGGAAVATGRNRCPDVVETEKDLEQYVAHLEAEREASAALERLGLPPVGISWSGLASRDHLPGGGAEEEFSSVSTVAAELSGSSHARKAFVLDSTAGRKAVPVPPAEDADDAETSPVRATAGSHRSFSTSTASEVLMLDVASANKPRSGWAEEAVIISPPTPATPTLPSLQRPAYKPILGH